MVRDPDPRGADGAISTVSGTGVSDGTRTTAARVGGKSLHLGRETSSLDPSASFLTADGTLWNASSDGLKRFEKGLWKTVSQLLGDERPSGLISAELPTVRLGCSSIRSGKPSGN